MTAPDRPGTLDSFGSPDGRTCSTPQAAGQAAYEAFAKAIPEDVFPEHLRDMGWTDWGDLRDHERPAWEAAAQAAIAAAAPAPPSADPDDFAERWFDGTFEDCGLTVRAAAMDGFRAGWAARAAAAPAPAAPGFEEAFAAGMRLRHAPCPSHDGEHHQIRTGAHWLCVHLLAGVLAAYGTAREPQPQAAPDVARAETAAIRAAAANTARELAEVTAERDALRYGIERAITHLEESASATSPSKKSAIEVAVAGRLRALLGGAGQPGTEGQ